MRAALYQPGWTRLSGANVSADDVRSGSGAGGGRVELGARGVDPEPLEVVEATRGLVEEGNHQAAVVEEHPSGMLQPFAPQRAAAQVPKVLFHRVGEREHVATGGARE